MPRVKQVRSSLLPPSRAFSRRVNSFSHSFSRLLSRRLSLSPPLTPSLALSSQAEADQIAFAMKKKDIPVEYVLYPDEGHGFGRPANRIDFNGRTEIFLEQHLGGRSEAFEAPEGNTATFPLLTQPYEYEAEKAIY